MREDFLEVYDLAGTVVNIGKTRDYIESFDLKTQINSHKMPRERDCKTVINFFEDIYDENSSKTSGLKYFNKARQKICATKTLNFGEDWKINETIYSFVNIAVKFYFKKYSYLEIIDKSSQWRLCPSYNLQRYDGENEGFFALHNETSGNHPYRMLAWMVYLNDAASGTEFPYQEVIVSPKSGRTVIWPAAWTHPHKGVTPNIGLKYIATGWFYYLPKGEPQFDGHHPDEKRIQEIIV